MDTVTRLKSIPLFAALAPADLDRLAQIAPRSFYPKGSVLCRQEDFGETLYIIDSGEAILHQTDLRGLERPTAVLKEGQFFGEDALLLGNSYGSCVQAITGLNAFRIRKSEFDVLRQEYPDIDKRLRVPPLIKEQLHARTLPGQAPDEQWLLRRGRHWFAFVRRLFLPFLAVLALIIVWLALYLMEFSASAQWFTLALGTVVLSSWIVLLFVDWRNDYYLVTTKRVLHRELRLLQLEKREEAPLTKIQNASTRRGFLGKMLNYGTLKLETAGARQPIVLTFLPDPEGMKNVIFRQAGVLHSQSKQQEQGVIRQVVRRIKARQPDEATIFPIPPQEPSRKTGILPRMAPSRPLLRVKYEQGNRIVWRKHWIFLFRRAHLAFPFLLLTTAVLVTLFVFEWPAEMRAPLFIAGLILWVIAIFWAWWEWTDWRNDEYIITDGAIIDVTRKPLFFDEIRKEAPLDMIQNVSLEKPGFWSAALNYGNVLIQTAGPQGSLNFAGVHRPVDVQKEIFRRLEAYREEKQRRERQQRRDELSEWFQIYDEEPPPQHPPGSGEIGNPPGA